MKHFSIVNHKLIIASILCLLIYFVPFRGWSAPIPGDINADGKIDILDIQNGINIAIGISEYVEVADVNISSTVDVLDVQILINTVLGVGGLVQRVVGRINVNPEVLNNGLFKVLALSTDGRMIQQDLSPNGQFSILLPVGTNWCLAGLIESEENNSSFPIYLPILNQNNLTLPIGSISIGNELDLGTLNIMNDEIVCPSDLRHLLGMIAEKLPFEDNNMNKLPDIYDSLFDVWKQYFQGDQYFQYLTSQDAIFEQFLRDVGNCANSNLDVILTPSLNLMEIKGYPEMLAPIMECVRNVCVNYLSQLGIPFAENIVNTFLSQFILNMQNSLVEWLNSLGVPELTDLNGNKMPDFVEDSICVNGSNCVFDRNGNGIPDFIEDADGDGVPNFLDVDNHTDTDSDGDGIPDEIDLDANGNGILDYAENTVK